MIFSRWLLGSLLVLSFSRPAAAIDLSPWKAGGPLVALAVGAYYYSLVYGEDLLQVHELERPKSPVPALPPQIKIVSINAYQFPAHLSFLHPRASLPIEVRAKRLAAFIREMNADVVLLQEVWGSTNRRRMKRLLPAYRYAAEGPSTGRVFLGVDAGLLILSRFPLARQGYAAWAWSLGADDMSRKGILLTEFAGGKERLVVATSHFQAGGGPRIFRYWDRLTKAYRMERVDRAQGEAAARHIARFVDGEAYVAFAGDFNQDIRYGQDGQVVSNVLERKLLAAMTDGFGGRVLLREAMEAALPRVAAAEPRFHPWTSAHEGDSRIDHLLTSSGLEARDGKIRREVITWPERELAKTFSPAPELAVTDHGALVATLVNAGPPTVFEAPPPNPRPQRIRRLLSRGWAGVNFFLGYMRLQN